MSTATASKNQGLSFDFKGEGGEFFKIWIVNILLSILTLGIYSAWAKVRTHRYFYGNTSVANASFDYLADPVVILKGRLIAAGLFGVWIFSEAVPILQPILLVLFLIALPWLVVRSLSFRMRNTAWRNIRFGFKGGYGQAAGAFIGWPLLGALTLGLLTPLAMQKQKKFIIDNSRFGKSGFNLEAGAGPFYVLALKVIGIFILGFGAIFAIIMIFGAVASGTDAGMDVAFGELGEEEAARVRYQQMMLTTQMIMMPLLVLVYAFIFAYANTRMTNLIYNSSRLNEHQFESTMRVRDVLWLYITNLLAIIFTLGLFTPWAMTRLARYRASKLALIPDGDLSGFVASEEESIGSTGEEVGEMFDIDIGI